MIKFVYSILKELKQRAFMRVNCSFWNPKGDSMPFTIIISPIYCLYIIDGYGDWSQDGCTLVNMTENEVVCMCNHLTTFCLLMV